jgi:hypothetical protein
MGARCTPAIIYIRYTDAPSAIWAELDGLASKSGED